MSTPTPPTAELSLVEDAERFARAAGAIALDWFEHRDLSIGTKGDGTPVTQADLAAETELRRLVAEHYPNDSVVGEEHGTTEGSGDRTWIVDPIDGTKAFSRGVPLFSTLLSVEDRYGPAVGIIFLPALDELILAARGLGCSRNGVGCSVSTNRLDGIGVLTTSGLGAWDPAALESVTGAGVRIRTWGDGYGYALVATGRAEAMVDPIVSHWDVAPMELIMSEAGGRFSAVDGRNGTTHGSGVGSNGLVHDEVLRLLNPSPGV